nr:class B sortase, LPKTxAVK-specific [Granulicatella sp. WM01]
MQRKQNKVLYWIIASVLCIVGILGIYALSQSEPSKQGENKSSTQLLSKQKVTQQQTYQVSADEKKYLSERFKSLSQINSEAVGYVYAPNTLLDEPIVQTHDNETYLDKTFEGEHKPLLGSVYMDMDNNKQFSDKLTWLFGHARGSHVPDHRMFKTVNYYDNQTYFDEHRYVVIETPERKYYYEAMFLIIVPENTAFYKTHFNSDDEFVNQLSEVQKQATSKAKQVNIQSSDNYLVLSTCREDDDTIRSNLYLRQITDAELPEFLAQHGEKLAYKPTR